MEDNSYSALEWKSATRKIFWSVIIIALSGVISTVYDYVSYFVKMASTAAEFVGGLMGPMGGSPLPQNIMENLLTWGLSSKGLVIIGYIGYLWGLTSFASIQKEDSTADMVRKVRTFTIALAVVYLLDIVFGVFSIIPAAGTFFGIVVWVLSLICFYKLKGAFGRLMVADDFNARAQRGARNLRFAAVCEIRLRWLPLITALALAVVGAIFFFMLSSKGSMSTLEGNIKMAAGMAIFVLIVTGITALCAMFCAYWWPIIGWYRIMTADNADATSVSEGSQKQLSDGIKDNSHNIQESAGNSAEIAGESSQPAGMSSLSQMVEDYKKPLTYAGAAIAALLVGWGAYSLLAGNKGGNDLMPVEEPKWEKFVVCTENGVALFKEANADSPQLAVMMEDIESDMVERYFKWSDMPDKKGYTSFPWRLNEDVIVPVIAEEGDWYKIQVSDNEIGIQECYVIKSMCREVKPEPITAELLQKMTTYDWGTATFGLQTEGKMKNICFISVQSDMYGESLNTAVLYKGMLINPLTKHITTQARPGWQYSCQVEDVDGMKILFYGETLMRDEVLDARTIAIEEKVGQANAEQIFNSIPTSESTMQEVSYYFPEVDKERLFTFLYDKAAVSAAAAAELVEDKKEFTGFSFVVDNAEDGLELFAEADGERRATEISGTAQELRILAQGDFDGDGEKEALVYEWGGGNYILPPYIVYFDKSSQQFLKAEGFDYESEEPEIAVKEEKGKTVFRITIGLRTDIYTYEDHAISLQDQKVPNVGEIVCNVTRQQMFGDRGESENKSIYIDTNGNGRTERLEFHHDDSHAMKFGKLMSIASFSGDEWKLTDEAMESIESIYGGEKFTFIKNPENDYMPHILVDDAWLFVWDGEKYMLKNSGK